MVDEESMRRIATGDESAFGTFYRRFAPTLFALVCRILRDQKEAEDVLQEAFVQMWKKAGSYDAQRSSVFTWAVMITRNKAIDRVRSLQRRTRVVEAVEAETSAEPAVASEHARDALRKNEDRELVQAALSHLPDAQREAISLAFFSGLTQLEISDRLGAPLGTVKARIRRGLLGLRDILRNRK